MEFPSNDECHRCSKDNEIFLCESCPKVFHLKCTDSLMQDDFYCSMCKIEASLSQNPNSGCARELFLQDATCVCCKKKINTVEKQTSKTLSHFTLHTEFVPVRCSLCQDLMHRRCIEVPLYLVLSGGAYQSVNSCTLESIQKRKQISTQIEESLNSVKTFDQA